MVPGQIQAGQGHSPHRKQSHLIQSKELTQIIPRQALGVGCQLPQGQGQHVGGVQGAPLLAAAPAAAGLPM